jgi:hypothetical protein
MMQQVDDLKKHQQEFQKQQQCPVKSVYDTMDGV